MLQGGATNYAESVDSVMLFIVGISVVLLLGITFTMIYFVFKYSRKRNPKAKQIHGNVVLEIIWIVIPTIIVITMFWYGFQGYNSLRTNTAEDFTINVWAFMWGWEFQYPNGKKTDTLYISAKGVTKLNLESRDVNHSLYIPAFRLKEDVIAGRKNFMYLTPDKPGKYDIACAEYCGLNHSYMYTKIFVLPPHKFQEWYNDTTGTVKITTADAAGEEDFASDTEKNTKTKTAVPSESAGAYKERLNKNSKIFVENNCVSCHTLDGSNSIGPSFTGLADGKVTVKNDDGSTEEITVTESYLRESIMNPNKQVVEGFRKYMMPTQKGIVDDSELKKMVEILKPKNN